MSVGGVLREAEAGRTGWLWRDQDDRIAGAARVLRWDDKALTFSYRIADLVYDEEAAGQVTLQLCWKGSQVDNRRPFASCPECPRDIDTVVHRQGSWCCALCHRLPNRSARIRKEIRWAEELAGLDVQLGASLLLATSRHRLANLEARRRVLQDKLAGRTPSANTDYLQVLWAEHVTLPAVEPPCTPA